MEGPPASGPWLCLFPPVIQTSPLPSVLGLSVTESLAALRQHEHISVGGGLPRRRRLEEHPTGTFLPLPQRPSALTCS
jgi:hypothetical protein